MLRSIFVFLILGTGIFASFFSRFIALNLYLWFALFRPQEFVWFPIVEWRFSLIIGLLLVVPCILTGIFPNISRPLSIGSLMFLFAALIAQFDAVNPSVSWYWMDYMTRLVLVSLFAVPLIDTQRKFLIVIAVISGSFGFYSAKAGLAFLYSGGVRFGDGLAGAFGDNNGYALGITMILPMLVAAAQNFRKKHFAEKWIRIGYLVAAPLSILAIVGTFSRGGFLGLAGCILGFLLLQKRRFIMLVVTAAIIAAAVPFLPIPEGYFDRIQSIQTFEENQDDSAMSRLHFWRVAMAIAEDRPLGVGLKGYESAYDKYDFLDGRFGKKRSVHSAHFEILSETGYFGTAIWIGLFLYALFAAFRIRRKSRNPNLSAEDSRFFFTCANALIASMFAFLVGGMFVAAAFNDVTWLTFALVTSLDLLCAKAIAGSVPAESPEEGEPQQPRPLEALAS